MPSATSASKKSRALRSWSPRRSRRASASSGPALASSVKSPSSTALRSVFDAQNPVPSCRIASGVGPVGVALKLPSLLSWGMLEQDSLQLGQRTAAEAHGRVEALRPELARVETAAQLVQGGPFVVACALGDRVDQDQVAGPLEARGQAHVALALLGREAIGGHDDCLVVLQALGDGGVEHLLRACLHLLVRHPARQEHTDLPEREHRADVLDHAVGEPVALRGRGRHDHEQAAGRVSNFVGRTQDAAAHRHVRRPRWRPVAARPVRGPPGALVRSDLDAAGAGLIIHDRHPAASGRLAPGRLLAMALEDQDLERPGQPPRPAPDGSDIRKLTAADVPVIAKALARAFEDDPVMSWIFRDDSERLARLEPSFSFFLRRIWLEHGECYAADRLFGAALWLP